MAQYGVNPSLLARQNPRFCRQRSQFSTTPGGKNHILFTLLLLLVAVFHHITILLPYYHHITIMLHVLPLFSSPSLGQNQKNPQAFGGNRGPRTATRPTRPRRTAMATMATMPRSRPVRSTEPEMLWDNIWNVVECCGMLWEYMEYSYGIIGIYGMNRNKHL